MKKIYYILSVSFLLLSPSIAMAAWTAADDFDSYSAGSSISGLNGGTGWTAGWSLASGSAKVDIAPSGGQGGLALYFTGSGSVTRTRSSTGSSGIVRFKIRITNNTYSGVYFTDSGGGGANSNRIGINFNSTAGQISAGDGQTYANDIAPLVTNVWYDIAVRYGQTAGMFDVSLDGGKTYATGLSMGAGNKTLMDGISIFTTGVTNFWVDDINDDSGATPLPNTIYGSGTPGKLALFNSTSTVTSSLLSDDGTNVTLNSGNLFLPVGSGLDTIGSGSLYLGPSNASSINIGNSNSVTTILGSIIFGNMTFGNITASSTRVTSLSTYTNCSSITSPASCGSASAGSVALSAGDSTLVVETTAVGPNSQIFITEDASLGSRLGITCNTTVGRVYSISNRTASTSFTVKSNGDVATNKACLNYWILN